MKIPIAILFERLLDFYFCFGMLGHQYRKRLKYKKDNQKKSLHSRLDESSYAYWKGETKQSKEQRTRESRQEPNKRKPIQHSTPSLIQSAGKRRRGKRVRRASYWRINPMILSNVLITDESLLMQRDEELQQQLIGGVKQASTTDMEATPRNRGFKGGNEKWKWEGIIEGEGNWQKWPNRPKPAKFWEQALPSKERKNGS